MRWREMDFDHQTICIARTYQRLQKRVQEEGTPKTELRFDPPKNGRTRIIPMQPQLIDYLRSMGKKYAAEDYILSGRPEPMEPRTCANHFKSILRTCGLPNVNFHVLRHTFASSCVEAGVDIKALSEILGHSSVGITMDRYVHLSMEFKKEQLRALDLWDSEALSRHNYRKNTDRYSI